MNFYNIKSKKPKCEICGDYLVEWNPYADKHEHQKCLVNKITDKLMALIVKDLNDVK